MNDTPLINQKTDNPYEVIDSLLKELYNQEQKLPPSADVFKKLQMETANVVRFSLSQWQTAYEDAIEVDRYDREDLLDLYEQIEMDEHVTALIDTIYNNIIANGFVVNGANREEDIDAKMIFERPWFSQWVAMAIDSIMHGFTGIQFTGLEDGVYTGTKLIPRRYILPLLQGIRYNDNADIPDVLFTDRSIAPWTSFLFPQLPADQYKLGKYNKIAKLFILKRENIQFWAMFNEIFGIPFRVMKTDLKDAVRMQNAITAMQTMTSAAYSVIQEDDEIIFHNGVAGSNTQTFKEFGEWCNKGMSKALVGSTMVLEDGSSRSQGEVHERNTAAFVVSYQRMVAEWINGNLIPKMADLGMAITREHRFKWDDSEILSKTQIVELISKLNAAGYNVPIEYVIEHTGIPVEEKEVPPALGGDVVEEEIDEEEIPEDIQNLSMFKKLVALYGAGKAKDTIKSLFKLK